jgi:hypothetical protein
MNLCFYNDNHIGDTIFSNPFIIKICESNKNDIFYQWCLYGNELVCGPENLLYLEINKFKYNSNFLSGDAPEKYTDNTFLKNLFISNHNTDIFDFVYEGNRIIALNTWCIPIGCSSDVDLLQLYNGFINKINKINNTYKTNFKFDNFKSYELLPRFKDIPIDKFILWKNSINSEKKIIFIYNYTPRLFIPSTDINILICNAAIKFPNCFIIVPLYNELFKNISNIKSCDKDFNCEKDVVCNNVLMINKINIHCNIIVSLCTGASWCWFDNNIELNNRKFFIVNGIDYVNKLNNWYKFSSNKNNNLVDYLPDNIDGIINIISNYI